MDEAIVVFSRKGIFKASIAARDVRSREHARKLWPLVSADGSRQMVTWVSPSFNNGKLRRRSHFRVLPAQHVFKPKTHFDDEEASRWRAVQESPEHRRAKELVAEELSNRLNAGLAMLWAFKDEDASDYPLEGNLLLGADQVAIEHFLETPFGSQFRLDVAVLGPPVQAEPMVLGGVEIELGHAFDGRKALIGKSLGFPLISIDITEMTLAELTPEWAQRVLTATTRSHEQGRRQTYIYLHDLLYPLYAQLPAFIDNEQRHQFLVFADDETLNKLVRWMNLLADKLEYPKGMVAVALVNGKNDQARKMLERAGQVVGPDWQEFNDQKCLRLTLPRPKGPTDLQAHRFHMTMARVLLSHTDALVGYKYCNGVDNNHPEDDVWVAKRWIADEKRFSEHRVLPKRLAEPVNRLIAVVSDLRHNHSIAHLEE
ncbi:hypothetical protein HMEPL2_31590 [Vreelandella aquamarina]|jgi:hypothetical protein|uniref:Uncharacterized protein n=1 Tax=Vreelandella aquamarina TaxID=77097 RepID=A0A6F8XFC1_9GAMM|nr:MULTISPECIES: hypothetical protein [Oceanospirillales]MAP34426.1 hypothetical protein [Halomonas sp.]MBI46635.1 hypothetical protein [Marinobacter sp.]MBS97589.1 hypothetical protein [Oceanospirillaceae bacterium]MCE7523994.1 hypothetical protein [Alloalcanivorax xenomutans]BCB72808.1 hypothetical protein HMEPL2_31590 [Halomonas meridiana]|tara:strand:- start:103 stop:1386 length:1284 start_codon:yes stop_codon:yes gene_type:complete